MLKMAPPVSIQLKDKSPWIAQSLATGTTEKFCAEIDENDDPTEVARAFVAGFVRERPGDELEKALLTKLPPLSAEAIRDLTEDELAEIAQQYLSGSATHIEQQIDPAAPPLDQLKKVLLARATARSERNKEMLDKIKDSASLKSLFGSSAIADLVKTQTSISAMQDHARGFEIYPNQRIEIPEPLPIDTTGRDMLSALQDLAVSSNEQLNLLDSQREQQALQSETLANMNTSLVALAEGTAGQAAKAERSARWALIVAAASCAITAGGVIQNYYQSKSDAALQSNALATEAETSEAVIRLLESSINKQAATLTQAESSQEKNEADNEKLRRLLRDLLELQRQQKETPSTSAPAASVSKGGH